MPTEIERRFFVKGTDWKSQAVFRREIAQGYFSKANGYTLRVRIADNAPLGDKPPLAEIGLPIGKEARLTIKGRREVHAAMCPEFDYGIPVSDAEEMMRLFCSERHVEKVRYLVPASTGRFWEVDEFLGRHTGLVIAELELSSLWEAFEKPEWLGMEITGHREFSNASLAASAGIPTLL